jgi:hypothetical protein
MLTSSAVKTLLYYTMETNQQLHHWYAHRSKQNARINPRVDSRCATWLLEAVRTLQDSSFRPNPSQHALISRNPFHKNPTLLIPRFAASATHGQLSAAKEAQPRSHALTTPAMAKRSHNPTAHTATLVCAEWATRATRGRAGCSASRTRTLFRRGAPGRM